LIINLKSNRIIKKIDTACQYVYVLPAVVFVAGFIAFPILYNMVLSVNKVGLDFFVKKKLNFVGISNYLNLFRAPDKQLILSIKNTMVFAFFTILLQMVISFSLAMFLNKEIKLARFARGALLISYLLPITITAMLFKYMFAKDGGIINYILMFFKLIEEPLPWLLEARLGMLALIITNVWICVPFYMLLFSSGLTTLNKTYIESALIDGAGWFKRLIYVIIPCISETIKIVFVLGLINAFKVFDLVFVMTGGGPGTATEVMSTLSYKVSFTLNKYSEGAAVANVLFFILLLIGVIYIRIIKHNEVS